jgi:hypothetical protein
MIDVPDIQKKYSPEMALIILICRVYLNKAQSSDINNFLAGHTINWRFFSRIAAAHQIRPLIFKVLASGQFDVNPVFIEKLRKTCFNIATGNLHKSEELARLNALFTNHGITNFPYKGVILSQYIFGDLISRETADIDFVIEPSSFPLVYRLLLGEGYTARYYNPAFERQILSTSHELMFTKTTQKGILRVEVHWAATNNMMDIPLRNEAIFADPQVVSLSGNRVPTFNLQNQLLVLLVHHGVNDVWRNLRHCLDITLFLEKAHDKIDWPKLHDATVKYRIRHTTEAGLMISRQLFDGAVPSVFEQNGALPDFLLENLLRFPPLKKRKLNVENLSQQLFLRDSLLDKLRLLARYIKTGIQPNIRDMEANPLKAKWYFMYYFIKPYRIIFKRETTARNEAS